jgi:phosphoribosyl-ATP pyrophosphohydrolase
VANRIKILYNAVVERRMHDPNSSRTAKLLSLGRKKMAQKLGEEATEVVIEAVKGDRRGVIEESADVLYHLVVLWSDLGIRPADIWAELDRRQAMCGIAEKLPKPGLVPQNTQQTTPTVEQTQTPPEAPASRVFAFPVAR